MKQYQGWIANAWRKEDADAKIITLQKYFIGILLIICTAFFIGWATAPSRLTVYIPPEVQNGSTIKAGTIPLPLIYSFAYELWQEINYWPQDGNTDYKKNIQDFWPYLTNQFKAELLTEYEDLKKSNQLQRVRHVEGLSGAAYQTSNVRKIDNDTWEVNLKMRLTEYKNNQVIKDIVVLYPLKITRVNLSPRQNPYGLAIAGFTSEPKRLSAYI